MTVLGRVSECLWDGGKTTVHDFPIVRLHYVKNWLDEGCKEKLYFEF